MPKSYSQFDIDGVLEQFELVEDSKLLFPNLKPISPSEFLKESLNRAADIAFVSEKARSEFIISPILLEIRSLNKNIFTIYSGTYLKADPSKGLTGECDFILSKQKAGYSIQAPIFALVEAKDNDLEVGIPQCIAQMVGARVFNQKKGNNLTAIYGCVTTGEDWQFLKLENNKIWIDNQRYYLVELDKVLGGIQSIINEFIS